MGLAPVLGGAVASVLGFGALFGLAISASGLSVLILRLAVRDPRTPGLAAASLPGAAPQTSTLAASAPCGQGDAARLGQEAP